MAELKLDTDVVQRAVASAVLTLLGDDSAKLVEGLVVHAMQADSGYGGGKKEDYFQKVLREVLTGKVRDVLTDWLDAHHDLMTTRITERIEAEQDSVLKAVTDDLLKKIRGW